MRAISHAKRSLDVAVAVIAGFFAIPICMLILVLIRMGSAGNPLFVQKRVGREGRVFRILKLRTMAASTADLPSHEVAAMQITKLGRLLRRTKLDELPQLWNVLVGDMSLVGPRPCLESQVRLIEARRSHGLLSLVPGITGPAQLAGIDMSEPERLAEVEWAYFRQWTFRGDMLILLRTAFGGGAGDAALISK